MKTKSTKNQSINQDECTLFHEAVKGVKKIKQDKHHFAHKTPRKRRVVKKAEPEFLLDEFSDHLSETVTSNDTLLFFRDGIQKKLLLDLRKGNIPPELHLDLHGMTIDTARLAVSRLLAYAVEKKLRCLHIIHGKGKTTVSELPVLKNHVNSWLKQSKSVLAFCSSAPSEGGVGAVNVLLKRNF